MDNAELHKNYEKRSLIIPNEFFRFSNQSGIDCVGNAELKSFGDIRHIYILLETFHLSHVPITVQ